MLTSHLTDIRNDELKTIVPAAFSKRPAVDRSDRYSFISSEQVINQIRDAGYVATAAMQDQPTRRNPAHVRHFIQFSPVSELKSGLVPQLLFWNSHNGRTKARLCSGFWRYVCTNGLVIGESHHVQAVRHSGGDASQIIADAIEAVRVQQETHLAKCLAWEGVELTDRKVVNFAARAMALRFGDSANAYKTDDVLHTRRVEDEGNTLWAVYNRVQENLMRGGLGGVNANGRGIRSRQVRGITQNLEFNQGLWDLADTFAQAA